MHRRTRKWVRDSRCDHVWVPLISLDTNIVDLVQAAFATSDHVDAAEAQDPPPRFGAMHSKLEAEAWAVYWLFALAPSWRSTLYTFSDYLYAEVARAADDAALHRTALDVLVREEQPDEYRVPDPALTPDLGVCYSLGIKTGDARHVADAVGLGCSYILTNDRQLRNRSREVEAACGLKLRRPSEFLVEAVRLGAPWSRAPWPWVSLERIMNDTPK